ncbi:hypothetical protein MBLNU230_g1247t1 [Neophaeotheca triangularis]
MEQISKQTTPDPKREAPRPPFDFNPSSNDQPHHNCVRENSFNNQSAQQHPSEPANITTPALSAHSRNAPNTPSITPPVPLPTSTTPGGEHTSHEPLTRHRSAPGSLDTFPTIQGSPTSSAVEELEARFQDRLVGFERAFRNYQRWKEEMHVLFVDGDPGFASDGRSLRRLGAIGTDSGEGGDFSERID